MYKIKIGKACSQNGRIYEGFQNFNGKPRVKRLLEIPRRRWEENVKIDLEEIGVNTRNFIKL